MLRVVQHISKPSQKVICTHLGSVYSGTSGGYSASAQTSAVPASCRLRTRVLSNAASENTTPPPSDKNLLANPQSAVRKRTPPIPVIYHPDTQIDKRVAKQEERFEKKYDIMPTEVLVYDNSKRCRRLKWMFHIMSIGAGLSWLNLASFLLQNYTRFNEENAVLAKLIELITLYRKLQPDFPYHTQVFLFLEASLVTGFFIMWIHLTLNRQLVRLYMDSDYGRFKAVFVEANKYNERTVEFSYKDVIPLSHPVPKIQNYAIKGLPYYIDERDFKHPKFYAYFRGSFDEILEKKV